LEFCILSTALTRWRLCVQCHSQDSFFYKQPKLSPNQYDASNKSAVSAKTYRDISVRQAALRTKYKSVRCGEVPKAGCSEQEGLTGFLDQGAQSTAGPAPPHLTIGGLAKSDPVTAKANEVQRHYACQRPVFTQCQNTSESMLPTGTVLGHLFTHAGGERPCRNKG
jgi:hypothetical protein